MSNLDKNANVNMQVNLHVNLNVNSNICTTLVTNVTYARDITAKCYMPHSCLRQAGA